MNLFSAHRNHPTYWAFVLHRLSGLALALFLPVHLYVLSLAIGGALDQFLDWTANPWVKAAEVALVVLLALHMAGGLRVLAMEFLPWRDYQQTLAAIAGAVALAFGALYLLNVV